MTKYKRAALIRMRTWVAVVVWCKPGGPPRPPKGIMPGGIPGKPFPFTCREGGGAWLGQDSVAGSEDEVWVGRGTIMFRPGWSASF